MSDHYIYLQCSSSECEAIEPIYVGDVDLEDFPGSGPNSFQGEFISTPCSLHVEDA